MVLYGQVPENDITRLVITIPELIVIVNKKNILAFALPCYQKDVDEKVG